MWSLTAAHRMALPCEQGMLELRWMILDSTAVTGYMKKAAGEDCQGAVRK